MEIQKRNNVITNGLLIIKALAITCCAAGFLNALDRKNLSIWTFVISLMVLTMIYAVTKGKTVKNIIKSTELHKAIKWVCDITIALSVVATIIFLFAGGTLILIDGFVSLYQAIF